MDSSTRRSLRTIDSLIPAVSGVSSLETSPVILNAYFELGVRVGEFLRGIARSSNFDVQLILPMTGWRKETFYSGLMFTLSPAQLLVSIDKTQSLIRLSPYMEEDPVLLSSLRITMSSGRSTRTSIEYRPSGHTTFYEINSSELRAALSSTGQTQS